MIDLEKAMELFGNHDTVKFILTGLGDVEYDTIEFEDVYTALEKQIPKPPNRFDGYSCPGCKGRLARQTDLVNQQYCHHCGQALKWEQEGVK